MVTLGLAL